MADVAAKVGNGSLSAVPIRKLNIGLNLSNASEFVVSRYKLLAT